MEIRILCKICYSIWNHDLFYKKITHLLGVFVSIVEKIDRVMMPYYHYAETS